MAVDVCDLCYGDLCRSCALPLKGRKDRVCKDCALTVSGVRGSGKPEVRGDRRTVKSRRKAYAAVEQPEDFFQFFDAGLPADALAVGHPPPPASRSDREKAAAAGSSSTGSDGAATDDGSSTADESTGIRRLLGRLKPNEPDPADGGLLAIDEILAEDKTSETEDDRTSETEDDKSGGTKDADAVSQLAYLRRRDRAAADADRPEFSRIDTDEVDELPTEDARATGPSDGGEGLPPDVTVAIPSALLPGLPDGHTDDPGDSMPPTAPDRLSTITAPHDAFSDPPQDPVAVFDEGVGSRVDGKPFPDDEVHADHDPARPLGHDVKRGDPGNRTTPSDDNRSWTTVDPFDSENGDDESAFQPERRRTVRPLGEPSAALDEHETSTSRPIGQLDEISDVSPRLRDLMADLSDQAPSSSPAENPFLKRSRVVSEPDGVTDFSTDPFSASERFRPDSEANDGVARGGVPAPVSPSSSPSTGTAEPAEPSYAGTPTRPESPNRQSVGVAGSDEESSAPVAEPGSQPAHHRPQDGEPRVHSIDGPTVSDHEIPEPETPAAATPPRRSAIAAYTPVERHPLAAFAESDRHPLTAFARPTTSTPPAPQPPPALKPSPNPQPPSDPQPPPIDDVFPSEPALRDVDRAGVGHPSSIGDVPPIDDVLPPGSTEVEMPSDPTDSWETWEPMEFDRPMELRQPIEHNKPIEHDKPAEHVEPIEHNKPIEHNEPIEHDKPAEHVEPIEYDEPVEPSGSWETWQPPEPAEPEHPTEHDEPANPSGSWETWQPSEPAEPEHPTEHDEPANPSGSWETWQPPEPSQSSETWEPTEPDEITEAVSTDEDSVVPTPGSTLLRTIDDASASWTAVDDVPDLDGSTPRQRADTDARGSWIPPALRGIAPDAKDAAEDLPRRRG